MNIQPTFEIQPALLLAGCPQFGDTGKVCPGAAWDRLYSIRLQAGLPKLDRIGYGVLVLPPEFPDNDYQHYYFAGFEATPETERNPAFFMYRIPQCQMAVFPLPGNDYSLFGEVQKYATETWITSSGYVVSAPFSVERYTNGEPYKVDVCFPVKRV